MMLIKSIPMIFNYLILVLIFFVAGTDFADRYSGHIAATYWITLILGGILIYQIDKSLVALIPLSLVALCMIAIIVTS